MSEQWELTEQERVALPAWARRGVMPHRPEAGLHGETQCEECCELWREAGCEVVTLTRALAEALVWRGIAERRTDAAEQDAARWASDAAALREEKLVELALHAEEVAALKSVLGAVSSWMDGAYTDIAGLVTSAESRHEERAAAHWNGLARSMRTLDRAVKAALTIPAPATEERGQSSGSE